jgi:hypothetical protein
MPCVLGAGVHAGLVNRSNRRCLLCRNKPATAMPSPTHERTRMPLPGPDAGSAAKLLVAYVDGQYWQGCPRGQAHEQLAANLLRIHHSLQQAPLAGLARRAAGDALLPAGARPNSLPRTPRHPLLPRPLTLHPTSHSAKARHQLPCCCRLSPPLPHLTPLARRTSACSLYSAAAGPRSC